MWHLSYDSLRNQVNFRSSKFWVRTRWGKPSSVGEEELLHPADILDDYHPLILATSQPDQDPNLNGLLQLTISTSRPSGVGSSNSPSAWNLKDLDSAGRLDFPRVSSVDGGSDTKNQTPICSKGDSTNFLRTLPSPFARLAQRCFLFKGL